MFAKHQMCEALLFELLKGMKTMSDECNNCPDCGCAVGQPHQEDCDVERCSVCGIQRVSCGGCEGHDPLVSVWSGQWPTEERPKLNIDCPRAIVLDNSNCSQQVYYALLDGGESDDEDAVWLFVSTDHYYRLGVQTCFAPRSEIRETYPGVQIADDTVGLFPAGTDVVPGDEDLDE
jgi:hypothetical protein